MIRRLMCTFLALAAVVVWWARKMERSRSGLALLAIRNDEDVAEAFGVDVVRAKLKAFVVSAFFPGVIGGIFAYQISYIDPHGARASSLKRRYGSLTVNMRNRFLGEETK